jgi:hypothetical protein
MANHGEAIPTTRHSALARHPHHVIVVIMVKHHHHHHDDDGEGEIGIQTNPLSWR